MKTKIREIIKKIDVLNEKLSNEYLNAAKKYGFFIKQKRISFLKNVRERNSRLKIPAWKYVIPRNIRHLLSIPFIYMIIFPVLIFDIFLAIYQLIAFSLYNIPKVSRKDYIIYDRRFLDYLNIIQKINCLYCSYVNGFLAYAMEISARTERYWCPIKAAQKTKFRHSWYKNFADYGNPEEWNNKFNSLSSFKKLRK